MADKFIFWEIHEVRKGLWAFSWLCFFGCWLAGQTNSGHVVGLNKTLNYWLGTTWKFVRSKNKCHDKRDHNFSRWATFIYLSRLLSQCSTRSLFNPARWYKWRHLFSVTWSLWCDSFFEMIKTRTSVLVYSEAFKPQRFWLQFSQPVIRQIYELCWENWELNQQWSLQEITNHFLHTVLPITAHNITGEDWLSLLLRLEEHCKMFVLFC